MDRVPSGSAKLTGETQATESLKSTRGPRGRGRVSSYVAQRRRRRAHPAVGEPM